MYPFSLNSDCRILDGANRGKPTLRPDCNTGGLKCLFSPIYLVGRFMDAAEAAHDACLTSTSGAGILLDFRERTIK